MDGDNILEACDLISGAVAEAFFGEVDPKKCRAAQADRGPERGGGNGEHHNDPRARGRGLEEDIEHRRSKHQDHPVGYMAADRRGMEAGIKAVFVGGIEVIGQGRSPTGVTAM